MVNQTESVLSFRLLQRSNLSQKNLLNQSLRMNQKKKPIKEEPAKPKPEAGAEEEAPKPKPRNPLDLLPPSKILDGWKRLYSNTKTNFRERMDLALRCAFGKMLVSCDRFRATIQGQVAVASPWARYTKICA